MKRVLFFIALIYIPTLCAANKDNKASSKSSSAASASMKAKEANNSPLDLSAYVTVEYGKTRSAEYVKEVQDKVTKQTGSQTPASRIWSALSQGALASYHEHENGSAQQEDFNLQWQTYQKNAGAALAKKD